jgi:hypothetical protein
LEVSIKYFAKHGPLLVGPHLSETLETRYRFAERKLQVGQLAADKMDAVMGRDASVPLVSCAIIQGFLFYPLEKEDELPPDAPLQSCLLHMRHLAGVDGDEKVLPDGWWYSKSCERVRRMHSKTLNGEDSDVVERWAILPKLYWLSPIEIPNSPDEMERYALPMLTTDDMERVLKAHIAANPQEFAPRTSR